MRQKVQQISVLFFFVSALQLQLAAGAANPAAEHKEKADFRFFHGDISGALEEYEECLKLTPQDFDAQMAAAGLCLRVADEAGAKQHAERACILKPHNVNAKIILAQILRKQGDTKGAITQLESALAMDCNNAELKQLLGFAFLAAGDFKESEKHFRGATASAKNVAGSNIGLSLALMRQGRFDEALQAVDKEISLAKSADADSLKIRGDILQLLGKSQEAIAEYKRAIELNPGMASAYDAMGNVYYKSNSIPEAIEWFKKGTTCKSAEAGNFLALAVAYEKTGKLEDAAREYVNAAFLMKDDKLANDMRQYAARLKNCLSIERRPFIESIKKSVSLGATKFRTSTEVFGLDYEALIDYKGLPQTGMKVPNQNSEPPAIRPVAR